MIAEKWTKSSRSGGNNGQCVEVHRLALTAPIEVRDSKDPNGPILAFTPEAFSTFVSCADRFEH